MVYLGSYNNMFSFGTMPMGLSGSQQYTTAVSPSFLRYTAPIPFVNAYQMPQSSALPVLSNVSSAANSIADRIVKSVTSKFSNFMAFGSSVISGIGNGISSIAHSISNFGRSMVDKARSFLGYNERNGSYKLFTQGRTEAWCADFVSYVARQCGKVGFNFPSVQGILDWGRRNGRFSTTAKVGDAIIFKGAGASHTGIVTRVENGRVYTIEGNTSDTVAERSYALSDRRITGFVTIA